ncbi:hypothetical protein N9N67_07210 [Bacteriovoracaceae bacterium]|nr:hypothetical protein [Bacteriovoracaceae bacterium]
MRHSFNLLNSFFTFFFLVLIIQLFASCAYFSPRKGPDNSDYNSALQKYKTLHVFYCSDYKGNFVNIHYPKHEESNHNSEIDRNLNFQFVYKSDGKTPMKLAIDELKKKENNRKLSSLISDIEEERNNSYWCDCYPIAKPSVTKDTFILDSRLYSFLSDQDKQVLVNDLKQTKKSLRSNIKECKGHMSTHEDRVRNRYKKVENNLFISDTAFFNQSN